MGPAELMRCRNEGRHNGRLLFAHFETLPCRTATLVCSIWRVWVSEHWEWSHRWGMSCLEAGSTLSQGCRLHRHPSCEGMWRDRAVQLSSCPLALQRTTRHPGRRCCSTCSFPVRTCSFKARYGCRKVSLLLAICASPSSGAPAVHASSQAARWNPINSGSASGSCI